MRITSNMFPNQLEFDLARIKGTMDRAQDQITTGQRVRYSGDDPAAYRRATAIQVTQINIQQLRSNIRNVQGRVSQDITTAKSLQSIISKASEIAVRTTKGILSAGDIQGLSAQFNDMIEQAVSLANAQYNGQFLYGGSSIQPTDDAPAADGLPAGTKYKPFVITRDPVTNQITGVTYSAGSNANVNQVEIEQGARMDVNTVGANTTGTSPRGLFITPTTNIFQTLIDIRDALAAGNVTPVQATGISELHASEDNTVTSLGILAANLSRLETADALHNTQLQSDEKTLSDISDTDLPAAVFALQQSQTAFQAALQVGAKTLNMSLIDFIR